MNTEREGRESAPWVIGELPDDVEMSAFITPRLHGSRVVWSQPTKQSPRDVILYDLNARSGSVVSSGVAYDPQFLDGDTVVWQTSDPGGDGVTLSGVTLSSGAAWEIPEPLAGVDMGHSAYFASSNLYALVSDPGDGGRTGRYGLVVWRPGWPQAIKIESTEQSAFLRGTGSPSHGDLFTYLVWGDGHYTVRVFNSRTGVIHEVYDDWAVPEFVGDSLRLFRLLDRETLATGSAYIPVADFETAQCP